MKIPNKTIFNFYEGTDESKYTDLTGINLNKAPNQLQENIKKLESATTAVENDIKDINAKLSVNATFSDKRLKTDIKKIEDAVNKVKQLNGYTFERNDIETKTQTGVIAQEVKEVLPEAVIVYQ